MSHCFYKKNSRAALNKGKYIKHLTIHINEFDKNLLKNKVEISREITLTAADQSIVNPLPAIYHFTATHYVRLRQAEIRYCLLSVGINVGSHSCWLNDPAGQHERCLHTVITFSFSLKNLFHDTSENPGLNAGGCIVKFPLLHCKYNLGLSGRLQITLGASA